MRRLAKVLRSRFFLGAVCIVLQLVLLELVYLFILKRFDFIAVTGWVLYVAVLLFIINRDDIPETKLPWLAILVMLPVVGALVFALLSSNDAGKKQYERYMKTEEKLRPYLRQTPTVKALKVRDQEAYAQATYLYGVSGMPCHGGSTVRYFPGGESFHTALLEDLESAESYIMMEYFIIHEGKMWDSVHEVLRRKVSDGVAVYVMYDDFGCMTTLPEKYYELLVSEGIRCVPCNKFKPVVSHIHNNRDHRKITIVDGRVGYTGGINLADEYINAKLRFGHWKDTAVRVEGAAVKNLLALFVANWNMQSAEQIDPVVMESVVPVREGRGAVIPFGDAPAPIDNEDIGKNVYLNMINSARDYIYITTPYLICDHELISALRIAARKGVDVRIITPHIPDKKTVFLMTRSNYKVLVEAGVKIYEYTPGFIHAKNFICDGRFAVCGTINLDYRSLIHHYECGVWMFDTACIADMHADFMDTVRKSQRITLKAATLRWWEDFAAQTMKIFSPLL